MYKVFRFSREKDAILKQSRGFSFEDIITSIENGWLIALEPHDNKEKYAHQVILSVQMSDGIYTVPAVPEWDDTLFLKTAYRSRVATKRFNS